MLGLELRAVQCIRGERVLFSDLSCSVPPGRLLRIRGANGTGKTSLLRMVCGLLTPSAGYVLWQGEKIARLREEFTRQLVYIGHAAAAKDELSAFENLRISTTLGGHQGNERAIHRALAGAGLQKQAALPTRFLSQGQRRRLTLARLMLCDTSGLWIMDEPFNALDAAATTWLSDLIDNQVRRGGIVALTSHHDTPVDRGTEPITVTL